MPPNDLVPAEDKRPIRVVVPEVVDDTDWEEAIAKAGARFADGVWEVSHDDLRRIFRGGA